MKSTDLVEAVANRLSASDVGKRLNIHPCAANRWMVEGVRGRKLPSFFLGGRRYTDVDSLNRFLELLNADGNAAIETKAPKPPSPKQRSSRAHDSGKRLESAGC